jgi:hypothetical protein
MCFYQKPTKKIPKTEENHQQNQNLVSSVWLMFESKLRDSRAEDQTNLAYNTIKRSVFAATNATQ